MDTASKLQIFFQTLGDTNRLRIIQFIDKDKRSVGEIVEKTGMSQPLVSHHLKSLSETKILQKERNGPFVYYSLLNSKLIDVLGLINTIILDLDLEEGKSPMFNCPPSWKKYF